MDQRQGHVVEMESGLADSLTVYVSINFILLVMQLVKTDPADKINDLFQLYNVRNCQRYTMELLGIVLVTENLVIQQFTPATKIIGWKEQRQGNVVTMEIGRE